MTPTITVQTIGEIEEFNLNTWPAARILHHDGWVMGVSGGYTRRANSVWPLYASRLPLQDKIVVAEKWYRSYGLPATFKMTDAAQPQELDVFLEQRGYTENGRTSVQTRQLDHASLGGDERVELESVLDEMWLADYAQAAGLVERARRGLESLLGRLALPAVHAVFREQGKPCAFAIAVLQEPYFTFYNVLVNTDARGRGYGTALMQALLRWGAEQGAQTAVLHVMTDNPAALGLYRGLGFDEIYQYWYRSQPVPQ